MSFRPMSEILTSMTPEEAEELSALDQLEQQITSDPQSSSGSSPARPVTPSAGEIEALLAAIIFVDIDDEAEKSASPASSSEPLRAENPLMTQPDVKPEKPDSCLMLAPEELDSLERALSGDPDPGQLSLEICDFLDAVDFGGTVDPAEDLEVLAAPVAPVDPPTSNEELKRLDRQKEKVTRWRRKNGVKSRQPAMSQDERRASDAARKKKERAAAKALREAAEPVHLNRRSEAAKAREAKRAPEYAEARRHRKFERFQESKENSKRWHKENITDVWGKILEKHGRTTATSGPPVLETPKDV